MNTLKIFIKFKLIFVLPSQSCFFHLRRSWVATCSVLVVRPQCWRVKPELSAEEADPVGICILHRSRNQSFNFYLFLPHTFSFCLSRSCRESRSRGNQNFERGASCEVTIPTLALVKHRMELIGDNFLEKNYWRSLI